MLQQLQFKSKILKGNFPSKNSQVFQKYSFRDFPGIGNPSINIYIKMVYVLVFDCIFSELKTNKTVGVDMVVVLLNKTWHVRTRMLFSFRFEQGKNSKFLQISKENYNSIS